MLNLIYNRGNNSYRVGQFIIRIDGSLNMDDFPDCLKMNPTVFSLFLHEYIHFIQDISTRYGLMKESTIYSETFLMAKNIVTDKSKFFLIPQKIMSSNRLPILENSRLLIYRMGSSLNLKEKFNGKKFKITGYETKVARISSLVREIYIILKTKDEVTEEKLDEIILGGEILSEGMAFLAEKKFCENAGVSPLKGQEYPYMVTQKFVKYFYPAMAENEFAIYQCIDACLFFTFNPGYHFVELLKFLKKNKAIEKGWNENNISEYFARFNKQLNGYFQLSNCQHDSLSQIFNCFKLPQLHDTLHWLLRVYKCIGKLRTYPYFTKCFYLHNDEDEQMFNLILRNLGTPLIQNDNYESRIYSLFKWNTMDVHPEYFEAVFCLRSIFHETGRCLLYDFCKMSQKYNHSLVVNETCNTPWVRLNIQYFKPQLCPFEVLWKHWGLVGKVPKKKK